MIAEMEKEVPIIYELIEKEFGTDGLTHLNKWIKSKIESACKKQREICSSLIGENWLDPIYNEYLKDNNVEQLLKKIKASILIAPSPLEV